MGHMPYEEVRRQMKKEARNDGPYTVNRLSSFMKQVTQSEGKKAANELMKETLSVRKRKYGRSV